MGCYQRCATRINVNHNTRHVSMEDTGEYFVFNLQRFNYYYFLVFRDIRECRQILSIQLDISGMEIVTRT